MRGVFIILEKCVKHGRGPYYENSDELQVDHYIRYMHVLTIFHMTSYAFNDDAMTGVRHQFE